MQTITIDVRGIPDEDLLFLVSAVRIAKNDFSRVDASRVADAGKVAMGFLIDADLGTSRSAFTKSSIDNAFDGSAKPLFLGDERP